MAGYKEQDHLTEATSVGAKPLEIAKWKKLIENMKLRTDKMK
jgi:hypothetical protein